MSFYKYHVFFCTNQRPDQQMCCENAGASKLRAYAKARIKELGMSGEGRIRINTAGCLDRCNEGPVLVVYPEDCWYTFVDEQDIEEIIQEHLINGRVVKRLLIK